MKKFLTFNLKSTSLHKHWDRWFVVIVLITIFFVGGRMAGDAEHRAYLLLSDKYYSETTLLEIANMQREAYFNILLIDGFILASAILILMVRNNKLNK